METPSKKSSFPTEIPNTADQTRPTDTEPKKETVSLNKDTSKAPTETAESEKAADAKAAKAEKKPEPEKETPAAKEETKAEAAPEKAVSLTKETDAKQENAASKTEKSPEETKAEEADAKSSSAAEPTDANAAEAVKEENAEEADEIVFAGGNDAEPPKQTAKSALHTAVPETAAEGDGVIFAEAQKNQSKSHIKTHGKKRSRTAVIAIVASIAAIAAVGGLFAWRLNRSGVETFAESSEQTSPDISVVSKAPEDAADTSDPSEEELDLETIDTTNILFGENVTVEGVSLAGKSLSQAYDAMQERLVQIREPISITVVCDGKSLTLTQNDFNYDTNIASVLVQAYHYSRGELNAPTVESSFDGKTTDFKVESTINTESVDAAIEKTADFYDVQPVNAHVTKFNPNAAQKFEYADGADGFLVDHDDLARKIKAILASGDKKGSVSITTHQTPFKITLADIKANTRLIASHSTTASNVYNSVYNMELAIKAANGTVVMPGERFSFNAMTGDTTNGNEHYYENGTTGAYLPSTAYSQGKVVQEYGGGICQASTTMYLCAVKANMEITDRYAHMYASSYAPYGLDATVDYGNLDMSFINPTEYPVYIATYVYDYNGDGLDELCVEMYGPLSEEYDEIVPVGWVTYAGDSGFSARGAKVFFKNGQEVKRENLPSGSYDYHFENYYTVINYMPNDISYGPSASATWSTPTVYSPYGVGDNGPVAYGTAEDVLKKARKTR